MKAALIMVIVVALAGCTQRVAPASVPAELLTCKPAPEKPYGTYTQRDVGTFIVGLHEAHADCRSKLGAVRGALAH